MAPRRIVCCKSCRKRFTTSTGSALCLSCRPKKAPPQLTYGGNSLALSQGSNEHNAKMRDPADPTVEVNDYGTEECRINDVNNVPILTERCEGSGPIKNNRDEKSSPQSNQPVANENESKKIQPCQRAKTRLEPMQRANESISSSPANIHQATIGEKNSKQTASPGVCHGNESLCSLENHVKEDDSDIPFCSDGQGIKHQDYHPSSEKHKTATDNSSSDWPTSPVITTAKNDTEEHSEVNAVNESHDCSNIMPTHKSLDDIKRAPRSFANASISNEDKTDDGPELMQNGNEIISSSPSNILVIGEKKRKHSANSHVVCHANKLQSAPINVDRKEDYGATHPCHNGEETITTPKKQKIEAVIDLSDEPHRQVEAISKNNHSMIDVAQHCSKSMAAPENTNSLDSIKRGPSSFEDASISATSRIPRVSLGCTINDSCTRESSDDEMDIMIAQGPIWSSRNKTSEGETNNEMDQNHTGKEVRKPNKEREEDGSDIEFLGTSSESQIISGTIHSDDFYNKDDDHDVADSEIGSLAFNMPRGMQRKDNIQACNIDGELTYPGSTSQVNSEVNLWDEDESCAADGLNFADNETGKEVADINPQLAPLNSPKKDVCYICGSDLSRLSTGLKGRVAHMKRCSAKYGQVLGGRNTMNNDRDFDADFVAAGAEEVTSKPSQARPKHDSSRVINPYSKDKWHGGANSELELNKPMTPTSTEPKQSMLKQFFKAPVRSLTNVLMAGAKQVAKGKAITAAAPKSGKQSNRRGNWSSRRSQNCPYFKRIPATDFIVDGFQYARKSLSENYFLTHFHSDHYGGITKTWSDGTIFCSLPTANLVHQQLGVDKRFIHPLPLNTPTVIASNDKPVTVTLLDANHCPGAIMFLFEVGNKKVLHVGDFRWHNEKMLKMPQLRGFSNSNPRLDELFLDTTYCNEKYRLPTQDEAISAAIEVAEKEMAISKKDKKMKTLFLFGSYTIGKEKIYLSVAKQLKMKVYVDSRRYRILSSLEWPKESMEIFTTKKSESSLWVVPLGSVNFKQMRDYMDEGNKTKAFTAPYGRVVGFRPTGWTFTAKDKNQRTLPCGRPKPGRNLISSKTSGRYSVHGVPYSEHSSFPELVDCLRCLKPKKITPTVSVSKSEAQVQLLLDAL